MGKVFVDLHVHLDGSVTPAIACRLAELQGIELPADNEEELKAALSVSPECEDLNDFLSCFALPLSLMQTAEGISEAVYLIGEDMRHQGAIYLELRFAPQLHCEKGLTQEGAVVAALDGLKRVEIPVNLILCCMRGEGNEEANEETLELTRRYLKEDGGVVALDLAGAEGLYPTAKYRELLEKATAYHIPLTVHAGEAAGADSVRTAVEAGARRIGHGVRIAEDADVRKLVMDRGVYLECCPTSNRQTKAVADMREYPLRDFLKQGIGVTLNTDDPAISRTTWADELAYLRSEFGLTTDEERQLLLNAVDAAFTTSARKEALRILLRTEL